MGHFITVPSHVDLGYSRVTGIDMGLGFFSWNWALAQEESACVTITSHCASGGNQVWVMKLIPDVSTNL